MLANVELWDARFTVGQQNIEYWMDDSAATNHVTPSDEHISDYVNCCTKMSTASSDTFPIEGYVTITLVVSSSGVKNELILANVVLVPRLDYNMFSLRLAADLGHGYFGDKAELTLRV